MILGRKAKGTKSIMEVVMDFSREENSMRIPWGEFGGDPLLLISLKRMKESLFFCG